MKQVVIFNDKVCFPLIVKVELEYTCSQFDTMQRLGHVHIDVHILNFFLQIFYY